ncbi:MAG: transcription elongation factor GreB [Pseudomonadales bacterium]
MGRWRAPGPKSSKYITKVGYRRLNNELRQLWKIERPAITQSVREAAAQGDRSDNAEYTEGKRQLRDIDRRVRYLSKRLEDIQVAQCAPPNTSIALFGAWVTLVDEDDNTRTFRIVGPDEIDGSGQFVSIDAPLARAILKKKTGDEVELLKPDGSNAYYELIDIEYRSEDYRD